MVASVLGTSAQQPGFGSCATRAWFAMARLPTLLIGALALERGLPTAPDGTLVPFDGSLELEKGYFKDYCKSKDADTRKSKCCVS